MTRPSVLEAPTAPDWNTQAFAAIEAAALTGEPCDAKTLLAHGLPKPPAPGMWGALYAEASKARMIRRVTGQRRAWLAAA